MPATGFVPAVGSARRSQGIFTYGIGSIVDFTTGSFMPLGQQHMEWQWGGLPADARDAMTFHEPRLQLLLGVREFRGYPVPGEGRLSDFGEKVKKAWGVPCVRFPEWLECPKCHRLGLVDAPFEEQPDGSVRCTKSECKTEVNPVRFIMACPMGHVDDFPWNTWAHDKVGAVCDNPVLFLKARGESAALSDLYVRCANCKATNGLGDIFRSGIMRKWPCKGRKRWLLMEESCGGEQVTLQRGGSNVHFAVQASMLSIPPASEAMAKLLEREWSWLSALPDAALVETLRGFLKNKGLDVPVERAVDWVERRKSLEHQEACASEHSARYQEYLTLCEDCPAPSDFADRPEFENATFAPPSGLMKWIDLVAAVSRIREVRALCGFTRIQPNPVRIEKIADEIRDGRVSPLSGAPMDWRPAVEVRGEGIFVRLNEEEVARWSALEGVAARAKQIDEIFEQQCTNNGYTQPYHITPRTLLVHSFAHVMIRRLSLDCGYSSASLRERLYISDGDDGIPEMAGVLIYTASPDSDGSLGGLVNLATPGRIESMIRRAVEDAQWCGNDPVCIETDAALGGERLSAASCHNCLLVPETACERFNRELDRGALVGFADAGGNAVPGFFANGVSEEGS